MLYIFDFLFRPNVNTVATTLSQCTEKATSNMRSSRRAMNKAPVALRRRAAQLWR
jgi:hypothetical protein